MELFRKIFISAATLMLLAGAFALIMLALLLNESRTQVAALPLVLKGELEALRADVRFVANDGMSRVDRNTASAIDRALALTDGQITATRDDLRSELEGIRADLRSQGGELTASVTGALDRASASVEAVASATAPMKAAAEKIDSALPFYTDCDAGMCLANIIYGIGQNTERTLQSVDRTMAVVARTTPPVADSVTKSADALAIRSRQSIWRNLFFGIKSK